MERTARKAPARSPFATASADREPITRAVCTRRSLSSRACAVASIQAAVTAVTAKETPSAVSTSLARRRAMVWVLGKAGARFGVQSSTDTTR